MNQREIKEKISDGWIHTRIILEILGKPKEHVEETLKKYVGQIKENQKHTLVISEFYSEPKEHGEKKELFTTFAELEILVKNPETLIWLCFDYMPSSVEIIEPDYLRYKRTDFSSLINDLLARLHDIDMKYKNLIVENNLASKSGEIMLRRLIRVSLKHGPKTLEQLSDESGISAKELFIFLAIMIEDKIVKKEGEKYQLDLD